MNIIFSERDVITHIFLVSKLFGILKKKKRDKAQIKKVKEKGKFPTKKRKSIQRIFQTEKVYAGGEKNANKEKKREGERERKIDEKNRVLCPKASR